MVLARREIVDHCLYGVDKNPVAAEMAKLSLWLTTMARERPFTFLDHAIQVGDSLLGITDLEQLRWLHLDPAERKGTAGFRLLLWTSASRRPPSSPGASRSFPSLPSVMPPRSSASTTNSVGKLADLACVADAVVGAALSTAGPAGSVDRSSASTARWTASALRSTTIARQSSVPPHSMFLRGNLSGLAANRFPDEIPMPWDRAASIGRSPSQRSSSVKGNQGSTR